MGDREALGGTVGELEAVRSHVWRPRRPEEGLHKEWVVGLRHKKGAQYKVAWQGEPAVTGTSAVQASMVVARNCWKAGLPGQGRAHNPLVAAWAAAVVMAMGALRCRRALQGLADL